MRALLIFRHEEETVGGRGRTEGHRGCRGKREKCRRSRQAGPVGVGPAPVRSQGTLPAAALERPDGGGGVGCQEKHGVPTEEQCLYSANAEDAHPEDPGLRGAKVGQVDKGVLRTGEDW